MPINLKISTDFDMQVIAIKLAFSKDLVDSCHHNGT